MSRQHTTLSPERWAQFTLFEQMANIGSEVGRAISWREKGNEEYGRQAFYRALELTDLTLDDIKHRSRSRLREITRLRECLVDYFAGDNRYHSTEENWQKYFYPFNFAARSARSG
jgi:hypothetical protein